MKVTCDKCKEDIDRSMVNVQKDTAYCPFCRHVFPLSSLIAKKTDSKFEIESSEDGTWYEINEKYWLVGASHRSYFAFILVPFTWVWAGGALSGLYGTQIMKMEFDLLSSLVGLPFLVGSLILIVMSLMSVFGKTIIYVEQDNSATIFTGIGTKGWYRYCNWSEVRSVKEVKDDNIFNQSTFKNYLSLEGKKRFNLGWGLSSKRLYYLGNFLKSKLLV